MTRTPFLALLALLFTAAGTMAQTPCGTVQITNGEEIALCAGETVELRQTNNLPGATFRWSPAAGLLDAATDPSPRVRPEVSGFYRVTATGTNGCTVTDSVFIDVDRLVAPTLISAGTFCEGSRIALLAAPVADRGNTRYTLLGNRDTIRRGVDPNFVVYLDQDSTFTLISSAENGTCEERSTVDITVTPARFEIPQDTIFACRGADSLTLFVTFDTADVVGPITWRPARFAAPGSGRGSAYRVRPVADVTYYAEATVNGCPRIDSVAVRLDSLPLDLGLTLEEEKDPYCQGDTFFVRSPVYDAGDFPLITHQWVVAPGLQSPRELYNAVFIATDSAELQRVTTNGICTDTQRVQVNVIQPPEIVIEPVDTAICPGQPVQLNIVFLSGSGTATWTDQGGTLSCTDCLDPIATIQQTTQYEIEIETGDDECSTSLEYTLPIIPNLEPALTDATLICAGDSRQLIVANVNPAYDYRITGGGLDTDDPATIVNPTETTTYTVVTDSECGERTQSVTLIVASEAVVTASAPSSVCSNETLTLNASVDPDISGDYVWTLPGGETRSGQQISVERPAPGTYTVSFTDALRCGSSTDQVTVDVIGTNVVPFISASLPGGVLVPNGGTIFSGNDVTLTVEVNSDQAFIYEWSGNYSPATATGESVTVNVPRSADGQPEPLQYTVTAISESGGCAFTATFFLNVEQSQVQIPDFFTPDNDGRNDRFRLFYNGVITDYTLIVYDRWGQKVFTSNEPTEGWDGTKNGTPQPADVYLFLAKFRQDGAELQEEGQVTLIR